MRLRLAVALLPRARQSCGEGWTRAFQPAPPGVDRDTSVSEEALMRGEAGGARAVSVRDGRLRFGDGWQFDCETLRLKNPAGDDVELTMMERALLRAFINTPQRALNCEHLVQATRIDGTSIYTMIHHLRRKLPGMIQTRRGEGYVFAVRIESV
jgi:DNA-binding response OmpR family regulator